MWNGIYNADDLRVAYPFKQVFSSFFWVDEED